MIKRFYFVISTIAIFILIQSCKNDIQVLAPYKDTTIIYGLLNPTDSVQYIRIHKIFLGEGDAYQFAQVPDSFYYQNILKVQLERWKDNVKLSTIDLIQDSNSIQKDTGVFANCPNILYKTIGNDSIYNDYNSNTGVHSIYKLVVTNLESGRIVTAETPIVSKLYVSSPNSGLVNFTLNPYQIKWTSCYFGEVYEVVIRFHYSEADINNPFNFTDKYVDWHLGQKLSTSTSFVSPMQIDLGKDDFFLMLKSKLKADPNIIRKAGKVDFSFTAGAEELYNYYRINNSSTGLSQSIPSYSNINGGLGIFSCRYLHVVADRDLDNNTLSELKNGQNTAPLNFK